MELALAGTYAKYSIKDLEALSKVKSHTIRIWEKRYGIFSPGRSQTNIRYYSNDDLKKILNIRFLTQNGFRISKIAEMSADEIHRKVQALYLSHADDDSMVESLIVAMIDLSEAYFRKIFNAASVRLGFEKAITDIVFPFFSRISVMWQTGVINPAQEHFASNIIRQKIIAATDALYYEPEKRLPKVLLMLPGSELHEIGLLLYNYALRYRGYPTVYLGQAVPLESVGRIVDITKPAMLLCSFANTLNTGDMGKMLHEISRIFPGKVLVSGSGARAYEGAFPDNIHLFTDLEELWSALEN